MDKENPLIVETYRPSPTKRVAFESDSSFDAQLPDEEGGLYDKPYDSPKYINEEFTKQESIWKYRKPQAMEMSKSSNLFS